MWSASVKLGFSRYGLRRRRPKPPCMGADGELLHRAPQQPGDVHLGEAEPDADLALRELALVVEADDQTLAVLERVDHGVQVGALEHAVEVRVGASHRVDQRVAVIVRISAPW